MKYFSLCLSVYSGDIKSEESFYITLNEAKKFGENLVIIAGNNYGLGYESGEIIIEDAVIMEI